MEDDRQDTKAAISQLSGDVAQLRDHVSRLDDHVSRLDERVGRVEVSVAEIKALLLATLPHLATKADVAEVRSEATLMKAELLSQLSDKPSRTYMWGVLAVLLAAYACGLAALAVLK